MPRSVFNLLWDRIKAGQEIFAYVKNLSKDGGFYWVNANVTASFDVDGNIIGYYSVRRKPSREAIRIIEPIYKLLLAEEAKHRPKAAIAAATDFLNNFLHDRGASYDEFVLSI